MSFEASLHRLEFDTLVLSTGAPVIAGDTYWFETESDSATFGNPEPIDIGLASLLMDGHIEVTKGHDNREAFFRVRVCAATSVGLAAGEQALALACGKRTELKWTPPDGWSSPGVFDVLTSSLEHVFDDVDEVLLTERVYGLRLKMLPFARSAEKWTRTFTSGTPTYTTKDACSSTAAFSTGSAVLATETYGGQSAVSVTWNFNPYGQGGIHWTGSLGSGNYLVVEIASTYGTYFVIGDYYYGNALDNTPLAAVSDGTYTKYFFENPGGSGFNMLFPSVSNANGPIHIGGIYTADIIPSASLFLLNVPGSQRAEMSLAVSADHGKGLILFTDPQMLDAGYVPDNSDTWHKCPEGTYVKIAKVTTGYAPATDYGPGGTLGEFVDVGRVYIAEDINGDATIDFADTVSFDVFTGYDLFGDPTYDNVGSGEVYLFRVDDDTKLLVISKPTSIGSGVITVEPPSLAYRRGAIFIYDDRAFGDVVKARFFPEVRGGVVSPLFVKPGGSAPHPNVTATGYPTWHTHPGVVDPAA